MKTLIYTLILALLTAGSSTLKAQNWQDDHLGLPGDNLNLFAVMNLFQNSETLEDFETNLNNPNTMVNNLDLNGDNLVDYIMVMDYKNGNTHNIVLRVALNRFEFQDVAVFNLVELRNGRVHIQLIGDVALYGPNYIIEPNFAETPNPGFRGNRRGHARRDVAVVHTTYYEVASWPVIVFITRPTYVVWRSNWHWGYTPIWWNPWRPHYWHFYHGYHYNWHTYYHRYYRPWHQPRHITYHNHYVVNIRNYSPTVVVNVNQGTYNNTYTRPETRAEGERLYTHRRSVGSTVPTENINNTNRPGHRSAGNTQNQTTVPEGENGRNVSTTQPATGRRQTVAGEGTENRARRSSGAINETDTRNTQDHNNTHRRDATLAPAENEPRTTERRSTNPQQGRRSEEIQTNRSGSATEQPTTTRHRESNVNQPAAPTTRTRMTPNGNSGGASEQPVRTQSGNRHHNEINERTTPSEAPERRSSQPPAQHRAEPERVTHQPQPQVRSAEPAPITRTRESEVKRDNGSGSQRVAQPQNNEPSGETRTRRSEGR